MRPKVLMLVMAATAVAGCTLHRLDLRENSPLPLMGSGGQVIQPKICALQVATLSRPLRDESIHGAVWRVADEHVIAPQVRRVLQANGLRIGLITGDLPPAAEAVLKAPPPHKVDPAQIVLPAGESTLVSMAAPVPQVSLLLNRENQAVGKDYKDASGFVRITADQEGTNSVTLRIVPEIHHGPFQRGFGAAPNSGLNAPMHFTIKDGQQEDSLRDLAVTLTLEPNQVAVVGCRAERDSSLGSFLFTQSEANSDRVIQKVLLVWATRTHFGQSDGESKKALPALEPTDPPDTISRAAWWRRGKEKSPTDTGQSK
jgi:hypothetical protein